MKEPVAPEQPAPLDVYREPATIETQERPALTITIQSWATPIVGLVMLVVGVWGGYALRSWTTAQASSAPSSSSVTQSAEQAAARESLMASVVADTRHFRGDPNAPVTIIEFADFQCPYCGRFAATAGLQIEEEYVQSGKVRFGYVNFAFLGPESRQAAEAAECASDQDKYWEYHDKLYASQSGENQGAFNDENLKNFAEELDLDTRAFKECLDSGKYASLIQDDTQAAGALGVQSTPTFLINGQPLIGAQPFDAFQQIIEPLLK